MYYESYEQRILKLAHIRDEIYRFRLLIIGILLSILTVIGLLMGFKGSFSEDIHIDASYVYGQTYQPRAKAFIAKAKYEYYVNGAWSKNKPLLPGSYRVRAVTQNGFKRRIYSEEKSFIIAPKPISITLDTSVVYGEIPNIYTEGLAYEDVIRYSENSFTFENIKSENVSITLDKSAFQILSHDGKDVTQAYLVEDGLFDPHSITIRKRTIVIETLDAEKTYDGQILTAEGYTISEGSIVEGDAITVEIVGQQRYAGSSKNEANIILVDGEGQDISMLYNVHVQAGILNVKPCPISIQTDSTTKIYDGVELSEASYQFIDGTALVEGDKIDIVGQSRILDVGSTSNIIDFSFVDSFGQDVRNSYDLSIVYGTLTISPRVICVQIENRTKIYDGYPCSMENFTFSIVSDLKLVEGDCFKGNFSVQNEGGFVDGKDAGTYEIVAREEKIISSTGRDVTRNYIVEYQTGEYRIEKRKIILRLIIFEVEKIYDGNAKVPANNTGIELDATNYPLADNQVLSSEISVLDDYKNISEVGHYKDAISVVPRVLDENLKDVSHNYQMEGDYFNLIDLRIEKRPIKIIVEDRVRVYTGEVLTCDDWFLFCDEPYCDVVSGQQVRIRTSGSIIDPGTVSNPIESVLIQYGQKDVTENYQIEMQSGWLEVVKRKICVGPLSFSKMYDGQELEYPSNKEGEMLYYKWEDPLNKKLYGSAILSGHTIGGEVDWEAIVNVGIGHVWIDEDSFYIKDVKGQNITTKYYEIFYEAGTVEITPREIQVVSRSVSRIEDGMPLVGSAEDCYISLGSLVDGHTIEYIVSASVKKVGEKVENAITSVIIKDAGGRIVGKLIIDYSLGEGKIVEGNNYGEHVYNYTISFKNGFLTLLKGETNN